AAGARRTRRDGFRVPPQVAVDSRAQIPFATPAADRAFHAIADVTLPEETARREALGLPCVVVGDKRIEARQHTLRFAVGEPAIQYGRRRPVAELVIVLLQAASFATGQPE